MRDQPRDRAYRPAGLLTFIIGALVIGVVALGLSIVNAVGISNAAEQREEDRIAADLAGCERGNDLRRQVVEIAQANEDLVDGVLEVVFAAISNPNTVARLRDGLAPVFAEHQTAIDAIDLTDCPASVPGSVPQEDP